MFTDTGRESRWLAGDHPQRLSADQQPVENLVADEVTVIADRPTGKRSAREAGAPTIATAAATLKGKLAVENTPLTAPERALMDQWLTTLADAPTATAAPPGKGSQRKRAERSK